MIEVPIYNQEGNKEGMVSLPEQLFALPSNDSLVHQVVVSQQSNQRRGTAHTKFRSEVRGGGKKPYRQKGTGRARHGSIRSPLWVGGGVTFGPRNEKSYAKKVNKKMQNLALFTVLSQKVRDNGIAFVDTFSFAKPKTQEAHAFTTKVRDAHQATRGSLIVVLPERNEHAQKSFANLPRVEVVTTESLSTTTAAAARLLLFANPETTLASLEKRAI